MRRARSLRLRSWFVRGFDLAAICCGSLFLPTEFQVFVAVPHNVSSTGQITASMTNIPNAKISRFDITGTATTSAIIVNDTITFIGGGTAIGVATLTKP